MSRRKTVQLNIPAAKNAIKAKYRHNVMFCEAMGRPKQKTWVTEWDRNHNLPSPEEAAKMCQLLDVTPEDIITDTDDVKLVHSILAKMNFDLQMFAKDEPKTKKETEFRALYNILSPEEQAEVESFILFKLSQRKRDEI